jgi:tryptophanyl-tRNA synthetase
MGWGQFKPRLTDAVIEALRPIQARYGEWRADPGALSEVLGQGRNRAMAVAALTLERIKTALGFLPAG